MSQNERKYCVLLYELSSEVGNSSVGEVYTPFIPRKGEIITFKYQAYKVLRVIYNFEKKSSNAELTQVVLLVKSLVNSVDGKLF